MRRPRTASGALAEALDGHLPRMAFVQYGQFYNDDPGFDIEAYYRRVAKAMLAALAVQGWHLRRPDAPQLSWTEGPDGYVLAPLVNEGAK